MTHLNFLNPDCSHVISHNLCIRRISNHGRKTSGFTLIELIVSLGIFSIVMVIATGSYLSVVSTTRNVQKSTKAVNNLATALTLMTNEIRNGSCNNSGDCKLGVFNSFSFTNSDDTPVTYCLANISGDGVIERAQGGVGCPSLSAEKITDSSVNVKNLSFWTNSYEKTINGITEGQYWIVISLSGKSSLVGSTVPTTYFETGVTFRQLTGF